jgi:hypothetical protein
MFLCQSCMAGEVFKDDECTIDKKSPCNDNDDDTSKEKSSSELGYVDVVVDYDNESVCLANPTFLIPHCTEYDDKGKCLRCDNPLF